MTDRFAGWPDYSYRDDPSVPPFSDAGPRTVMDAQCALCADGAQWISRNDRQAEFKIIPLQSQIGRALMLHYALDPDDPSSWLLLLNGRAYTSLDALIRVGTRLGGIWSLLRLLRLLPLSLQDRAYRLVAGNRYRLFGRGDLCSIPDEDLQRRLLR